MLLRRNTKHETKLLSAECTESALGAEFAEGHRGCRKSRFLCHDPEFNETALAIQADRRHKTFRLECKNGALDVLEDHLRGIAN